MANLSTKRDLTFNAEKANGHKVTKLLLFSNEEAHLLSLLHGVRYVILMYIGDA